MHIPTLLSDIGLLAEPTLPKEMQLIVDCLVDDQFYLLDTGQLQDALLNLLLNARDACGAQGTINLSARVVSNTWIEFMVKDTGPGFSDEALIHGMDPFFTTKGAEGSGLGLPGAYDMAKLAGGDLRLSNDSLGGAKVSLRVPARPAPPDTGGLVLLVEDREDLRAQYRDMLLDMGHAVIEAVSADEALALLADIPDIRMVLSDLRLEGSATGADLARHIDGKLPVILMTSLPDQDPLLAKAQRLAPVLQKPFEPADLNRLMTTETLS